MNASEILAAARANAVGPYLPAKVEWLREWQGPAEFLLAGAGWRSGVVYGVTRTGYCHGVIWIEEDPSLESSGFALGNVCLDTRIPAVRDHLVRLGCPEWARDVPAAVWCWGMGVEVADDLGEWRKAADNDPDAGETWVRHRVHDPRNRGGGLWVAKVTQPWRDFGWECSITVDPSAPWTWLRGPETGDLGRACADLAALLDEVSRLAAEVERLPYIAPPEST